MDAKGMFDQFIQTFPQSEFVDEARGYINKINEKLARKNIVTVRWYHRRNHPRAAIIYCDKILDNFPGNESWVEAAYTKGCILLDLGRSDEAIVEFNRVLAYPDRTKFHDDAQSKLAQAKSR